MIGWVKLRNCCSTHSIFVDELWSWLGKWVECKARISSQLLWHAFPLIQSSESIFPIILNEERFVAASLPCYLVSLPEDTPAIILPLRHCFADCPPLVTPKLVSLSTRTSAFGTKVTASCPRGFEFRTGRGQMFHVTCLLGGRWTEDHIPDCQRKIKRYYCEEYLSTQTWKRDSKEAVPHLFKVS